MSDSNDLLDRISVATPCTQSWDAMTGDAKRRFCAACRLHVHDLSQMTRAEAEELVRSADGRVCVRLYRRPDGRVLTQDCVTLRDRLRRRARRLRVAAAAALAFVFPFASGCGGGDAAPSRFDGPGVFIDDDAPIMGDVCIPTVQVQPAGGTEDGAEMGEVQLPIDETPRPGETR